MTLEAESQYDGILRMPALVWHDRSFFLEVKPRTDLASLFVDCPPVEDKENESLDLFRVSEHLLELGLPPVVSEGLHGCESLTRNQKFCAKIAGISLQPGSVCSPTWADNKRLFMCKVHAEADDKHVLVTKQLHRLAKDMCPVAPLETFVASSKENAGSIEVHCIQCGLLLLDGSSRSLTLGYHPTDDWMNTTPSVDYFCKDTCGSACDPHRNHSHGIRTVETVTMDEQWEPRPDRIMISHSHIVACKKSFVEGAISDDDKIVKCSRCCAQLGTNVKNHANIVQLHHSTSNTTVNGQSYIEHRFADETMFFTQVLLTACESHGSVKLVIRSLDRTPHMLVWLLEQHVILASGNLHLDDTTEHEDVKPFPAVKMLYKVFDAQSAASDPRANGEDASVGLVDLPLACVLSMTRTLLESSHGLPPACRSVGQFYVGFLKLANSITEA